MPPPHSGHSFVDRVVRQPSFEALGEQKAGKVRRKLAIWDISDISRVCTVSRDGVGGERYADHDR